MKIQNYTIFFQLDKLKNILNEKKLKNKNNRLTIWSLLSFNSWIKNNMTKDIN